MFNVIDAQSTFTAVGRFQAYPVLMSLQHGVIATRVMLNYAGNACDAGNLVIDPWTEHPTEQMVHVMGGHACNCRQLCVQKSQRNLFTF